MMTTLVLILITLIEGVLSPQGSNITFAALCALTLIGVPTRWVLPLTILLHLALAFASGGTTAAL